MAIFEIVAKSWWIRSTTVNGFEFQSCTDCLEVYLPPLWLLLGCWAVLLSFSWAGKSFFTGEKCTVVPVEKCSAQSSEMTVSVWDLGERKGCVRKKAKRKSSWRHLISVNRARCWALALECWGAGNSLWVAHAAGRSRKHCISWQFTTESLLSGYSPLMSSSRRENEAISDAPIYPQCKFAGQGWNLTPWESKQRFLHLPAQCTCQYKVNQGCPEALGRWQQGAGDMCPHHQCILLCCRTVPSRAALIDSMGRDWSTSYPCPEFSSFSINILPKLFSRKFVPQPTVLPGWSSGKWKKTHWNQQHKSGFFVWAFENLKKGSCGSAAESALDGCDFWAWFLWSNFTQNFDV